MNPQALLIGLLAGLASALLFAGLVTQSSSAVGLAFVAPMPIMIASLGWGSVAGFVAALAAFGAVAGALGSFYAGLTILLSIGLPAAILGHLCGLARPSDSEPAENGKPLALLWYPLERVLLAAALLSAFGCIVMGWLIGYNPAELAPEIAKALSSEASSAVSPEQMADLGRFVVTVIPYIQPAFLVLTLVICLYLSAAITRLSGRLPRPKDDIPAQAGLPRIALPLFAGALALCFVGGAAGLLGAVFTGALGCALTMVGLAAMHRKSRGRAARGLMLFTAYAAILLLSIPLLAFLALGLFETAKSPADAAGTDNPR
ncbi:hypothetical protein [Aureimonas sp. D3]|uniref:hypothetical protein n=1 Tax=Aureimonas sp. D3 TaxID=1638164 RepID=UPI000783EA57|nr:hypothetical protein [Aureimonas sp. D3]